MRTINIAVEFNGSRGASASGAAFVPKIKKGRIRPIPFPPNTPADLTEGLCWAFSFEQDYESAVFQNLKHRLLLRDLDRVEDAGLHALIMYEANRSAELAKQNTFPILLFPCLFEERVRGVLEREALRHRDYWRLVA